MIKNIQALRALAAVMVVFYHLKLLLVTLHVPDLGSSGVDLFFVISGFVMVHTTRAQPPSSFEFARNRIARIVPIYWLMTCGVFFVAMIAPSLLGSTRADPSDLIRSLLFIPFTKGNGQIQPVLFVGWTLNYEMFFYAIFAVGLMMRNYTNGIIFTAIGILAVFLLGNLFRTDNVLQVFYSNVIILEFALGMGVAYFTDAMPKTATTPVKLLTLTSLLAIPILFAAPALWTNVSRIFTCGLSAVVVVTGAVLLERWGWRIRSALVMAVGDASYILYLSHPYITQVVQKLGLRIHATGLVSVALIVGCIALVVVVSLVLHAKVDRPLSRAVRRVLLVQRMQARPA